MVTIVRTRLSTEEEQALKRVLEHVAKEEKEYALLSPIERKNHIFHSVLILRSSGLCETVFEGGKIYSTPGAVRALAEAEQLPEEFLSRHFAGDWGNVGVEDWQENQLALENGFRLFSVYETADGQRLWVITEADRSATTLLLPEEY